MYVAVNIRLYEHRHDQVKIRKMRRRNKDPVQRKHASGTGLALCFST